MMEKLEIKEIQVMVIDGELFEVELAERPTIGYQCSRDRHLRLKYLGPAREDMK
jgi:hypothetical protein